MTIAWERQPPSGHELATCDDGHELVILDLGGVFEWQLARPTPGHGGFIEGDRIDVVNGDRAQARERARVCAEEALARHFALIAELEGLT